MGIKYGYGKTIIYMIFQTLSKLSIGFESILLYTETVCLLILELMDLTDLVPKEYSIIYIIDKLSISDSTIW